MKAAYDFVRRVNGQGRIRNVRFVEVRLFGSLGATGEGHGTVEAIYLGLEGHHPSTIEAEFADQRRQEIRRSRMVRIHNEHPLELERGVQVYLQPEIHRVQHPNALVIRAEFDDESFESMEYYSVGGGFVVDERGREVEGSSRDGVVVPFPFRSGTELVEMAEARGLLIADIVRQNEYALEGRASLDDDVFGLWLTMQRSAERGRMRTGNLPGRLRVPRRAGRLFEQLGTRNCEDDSLSTMDDVVAFAIAVNEENASGGRIVTAPTNGAAGTVPAVLRYLECSTARDSAGFKEKVVTFLLTAGAVGMLIKGAASISGAEVGCQGEVGTACAMAAGGLAAALGGTVRQVENAAEIGLEHNLGLTCDPIGGLVQIPCIERNALAAVKSIAAARMALRGDGTHYVSLDAVIDTMRRTGADMAEIYKETSLGGLAVAIPEC
jgi:L-serine dehydratase